MEILSGAPSVLLGVLRLLAFIAMLFAVPLITAAAQAQENDVCFACHGDPELEGENGKRVFVDEKVYSESIHGRNELECIMCHQDLAGVEDWPHAEDLDKVDCSICHDDVADKYDKGLHGVTYQAGNRDAPSCSKCHGAHDIFPSESPKSRTYPFKVPSLCDGCHADPELAKRNGLKDPSFIKSYDMGVHGKALRNAGLISTAICTSCHGAHEVYPSSNPEAKTNRRNIPKTCGACHVGVYNDYTESVHGMDYLKGIKDVPVCTDCHGEHRILPPADPGSSVYATRVGQTCSRCHDDAELVRRFGLPPDRLKTYNGTYHGIAARGGDARVANCSGCHGVHKILPSSNPESRINPKNLPETCGQPGCHEGNLENVVKGKVHIIETREDNVWAYIVSMVYKIIIAITIGSFLIFILVDLYARYRRHKVANSTKTKNEEEKES